jgi:hypothetical protein
MRADYWQTSAGRGVLGHPRRRFGESGNLNARTVCQGVGEEPPPQPGADNSDSEHLNLLSA